METAAAVTLCRDAASMTLSIASPVLIALLAAGLVIGLLQAATQIQEQTFPTVVKLITGILVLAWLLPWMTVRLVEYTRMLWEKIPETIGPYL